MAITGAFTVTGLNEVKKAMANLPDKVSKKVLRQELRAGARQIANEAKQLAPVDTGDLKRSIKIIAMKRKKNRIGFTAGFNKNSGVAYGPSEEFGAPKRHIEGQHFLENALLTKGPEVAATLAERIKAGILREAQQ